MKESRMSSMLSKRTTITIGIILIFVSNFVRAQALGSFDIVITNGHIIDGTGSPWYSGDLGIRDGKIAAIGNLSAAQRQRTIDAAGKVVAPGFIDMLGQSELTILVDPRLPSKIYQGITSEITGEGNSIAPLNDAIIESDRVGYDHYKINPDWRTLRQYFARLEKQGMRINFARIRSRALREDRRVDRPRDRSGQVGRHLCHAHAQRERLGARSDRRSPAHRPRGPCSRRDLAH